MSTRSLNITIHDSGGVHLVEGCPSYGKEVHHFSSSAKVKTFTASADGTKLAIIASGCVQLLRAPSWAVEHTLEHPSAQELHFSPGGSYLAVWCLYIKKDETPGSGTPNLHIYDTRQGGCSLLNSFYQISQLNWQPQWTGDDAILARNVTNEVQFYKSGDLKTVAHKRVQPKLRGFSLSPSTSAHNVVFFTPSIKGAPCLVNMFKYPNFKENEQPITSKSFYKVDSLDFMWNKACTAVLLLTSADKGDEKSYYGERMVFLLNSKTAEAIRISFSKEGPVSAVSWTPDGKQFLAVFGSNPAQCSVFDIKGTLVHSLEEGARNMVLVNSLSNLAMVGGCGNISPRIEMWELSRGTRICNQEVPDVTYMQWSPCGQYLLTATCSPRLRVNNGYRIYHYSGSLQYEYMCPKGTDLFRAEWMPLPAAAVPFTPSAAKVAGIQSTIKTASTERYIPPGQRNAMSEGDKYVERCTQYLRQMDVYDPNAVAAAAAASNTEGPPLSKTAARNKKRREVKRLKDEAANIQKHALVFEEPEAFVKWGKAKPRPPVGASPAPPSAADAGDNNTATNNAKNIKKKLQKIQKMKRDRDAGKDLTKGQLAMMETESALQADLKALQI